MFMFYVGHIKFYVKPIKFNQIRYACMMIIYSSSYRPSNLVNTTSL